eukprot:GFKZ01005899.1.p1 GENE.GFKZ01005899.1~~GFKZ01005899.1.p1  ORF type:complete len:468 (-),score=108.01 GFKZ01005899.1:425-1828(-)
MVHSTWNITSVPAYASRSKEEIDVLWASTLPVNRDADPAIWDALVGFFEDAIVSSCTRPGHLVTTPRQLLKLLKHNGTEPSAGIRVIEELFKRGDIVSADTLKAPTATTSPSSYSFSSIRSTLSSYIWGPSKPPALALDDPIVPVAALKAVADRVSSLSGAVATADIYTVKTFADQLTAGSVRDAEAVIAHVVSNGHATTLFTLPTKEDPDPVLGVKLGKASATQADRDVLRTKAALERMERLSTHLEESIEAEKEAAVAAAKSGNKADALARLKKKKGLEGKLTGARAAATKLGAVLMAVDEAESNREAVAALETGMASLKTATADGVTADRVDAVAADFDEMLAEQQEVRTALEQLNQDVLGPDEAELEEELESMMAAKPEKDSTLAGDKPAVTAEEEELMKLLQQVEITPDDVRPAHDPAAVAMADAEKAMADAAKVGVVIPEVPGHAEGSDMGTERQSAAVPQ